jgi:hypothetical protein
MISKKKKVFQVSEKFQKYLEEYERYKELPLLYEDLMWYDEGVNYYDTNGEDTLWQTVFFNGIQKEEINKKLLKTYAIIRADGELTNMQHLVVDRIDLCTYGNTRPYRIRILNTLNENFDYFYVKRADSSRIYGLELEDLLSPNRIQYFVYKDTMIEEHISGIPGDKFIESYLSDRHLDEVRLAKEFVKFNERCFIRLLGDMHSSNYVVDITPDFEETIYRIRAIDFDQQSYEGRLKVYLPQFFKENNPIIFLGFKCMTPETVKQYQREERALIYKRMIGSRDQLYSLLELMSTDCISTKENVEKLRKQMANHYKDERFLACQSMGELVNASLNKIVDSRDHTMSFSFEKE